MFVYNILFINKGDPMETSLTTFRDGTGRLWNIIWQALILGVLVGPLEGFIIHFLMKTFGILDTPTIYG